MCVFGADCCFFWPIGTNEILLVVPTVLGFSSKRKTQYGGNHAVKDLAWPDPRRRCVTDGGVSGDVSMDGDVSGGT